MEALESVYDEIATTKMKYDHLFNICTTLLKSWPHRDSAGKLVPKKERLSQEGERTQEDTNSTTELEVVDKALEEMQLLDAVLQKAKMVRTSPQHKPKCPSLPSDKTKSCSLSSKSSQQVAKVYKQPISRTQKSARRVNSSSKNNPKVATIAGQRKKSASSVKMTARSTEHLPSTAKPIGGSDSWLSAKPGKDNDRRSCSSFSSESEREADSDNKDAFAFDIKQHGAKLTMPSRYYKVQQALSKLSEEPYQQGTSAARQHFCKRLSSHSEHDSLQGLYNTLLAEELGWLKKRLLSFTPHELTVNERSPWEDVSRIKTTLEALTEYVQKVSDIRSEERLTAASLKEVARRKEVTYTAPGMFVYSSLEEWESMATAELQLLLSRYELDMVEFVNQKLLPLLPVADCPTHMIQTMYELSGISKPIYVKLSDHEN